MIENASPAVLTQQIEAEAFRLGFCLFGVTHAAAPENYPTYEQWLAQGLNAGMSYMASTYHRNARRNPSLLLPGVKSILVLGWPYELTLQASAKPRGWIAGYGAEADYHHRLLQPMQDLVDFIERHTGIAVESRCYTDSAPILERELGRRAGLGWIARNSCLISPKAGSNFLLTEIFLDFELPPSHPFAGDRCGTCHRCIDACPTHCIRNDRTIDAGKCIAYLTIENKDGMPPELRNPVGEWLFGCDICQTVCPWNSRQARLKHGPQPGAYLGMEEMANDLMLTNAEFKAKWAGSPILRAKRTGYLRNLVTVIGNAKDEKSISALKVLLNCEPDASLHELIQWALAMITA